MYREAMNFVKITMQNISVFKASNNRIINTFQNGLSGGYDTGQENSTFRVILMPSSSGCFNRQTRIKISKPVKIPQHTI
jgi:hypothetical protein